MFQSLTDQSLIHRLRAGDEEAAGELHRRYANRVYGLVSSQMADRLRRQVEPEDIVQSVFKSIFRGVISGGYNAPEGGSIWHLIAIVAMHKVRRNATKRLVQKRDSRREQPLESPEAIGLISSESPEEFEVAVKEALECLLPIEQSVAMLRIQGYQVEEISQHIDRSRRSVERILQNIREKFVAMLETEIS